MHIYVRWEVKTASYGICFMRCGVTLIFLYQDLVDIDVFNEAKKVIDALQIKEVAPALAWCADNKSRLKKSKVHTDFNSILQAVFFILSFQNKLRGDTDFQHHYQYEFVECIGGAFSDIINWRLIFHVYICSVCLCACMRKRGRGDLVDFVSS